MPGTLAFIRTVGTALAVRFVFRSWDCVALAKARLFRPFWVVWRSPASRPGSFALQLLASRHGLFPDAFTYGEVFPAPTARLLRRHGLGPDGHLLDLGCGRGAVLLAARALQASATGFELVPEHLSVAAAVPGATLVEGDARQVSAEVLGAASHVWLAWTAFATGDRQTLAAHLAAHLQPDAVVVALTWELPAPFVLKEARRVPTTWGVADAFVYGRGG